MWTSEFEILIKYDTFSCNSPPPPLIITSFAPGYFSNLIMEYSRKNLIYSRGTIVFNWLYYDYYE